MSSHPHHQHHHHQQWDNKIEFLMTIIGYAVGLGNVWRFPFLCFKNGGSAFVIAFVILLLLVGLPLFFLELTISQYSKLGPLHAWQVSPLFRGIGYGTSFTNLIICIYYNLIISYSLIYTISSFLPVLPWTSCTNAWNDEKCFVSTANSTLKIKESPTSQYFYKFLLEMSKGVDEPIGMNTKITVALFVCWLLAFLSLYKGIKSLGKVSYVTAIYPYIMIFALIIRGVTLPGAMKGIKYYIGSIDISKLFTLKTWIDASSQVYFCLGIAQGSILTLGKGNKFNYNHQMMNVLRTSVFVCILDGATGVIAGFAIFTVLGFMAELTGNEVSNLAVGGPGLTFIVYPEGLSMMPFPWIWSILFFMMMITIGFGSLLACAECFLDSAITFLNVKTDRAKTLTRMGCCLLLFLLGIPLTTKGGYYLFNLLDAYTCTLPLIIIASLQSVALAWCYGFDRIQENIKLMLNKELNIFWKISIKYTLPILSIIITIVTIASNTEVTLNSYRYPAWAHVIGWGIVTLIFSPIVIGAVREIYNRRVYLDLYELTQPDSNWQPAFDRDDPRNPVNQAGPAKATSSGVADLGTYNQNYNDCESSL